MNENISSILMGFCGRTDKAYSFSYDQLNRLTEAVYSPDNRYNEKVEEYDLNGNIKSLSRSGYVHDGISMDPIKGLIDDLTLEYRGNRLVKVSDNVGEETVLTSNDFKDVSNVNISDEYLYDACGNATADLNRGIAWVKYNCLHLPTTIQFSNGNKSSYAYDARGMKRSVQHAFSLSGIQIPFGADTVENTQSIQSFSQTDYCGNFIYEDAQLSRILTPEGYIETTDYYPFGLEISTPEGLLTSGNNPYLYNGKELDRMHGLNMYDYGARFYGPEGSQFFTVDPLAEKYYSISPYAYCANNPINFIDPDGRQIDPANQDEYDRMQRQVERKHDRLDNKLQRLQNRGASQARIDKVADRVNQLAQTENNLNALEASPVMYQLNSLDPATNSQGYLSYNANGNNGNGAVVINYIKGSTSNFVHESTHAGQYETHDVAFANANPGGNNTIGIDLHDEVAAYKAQYAFSPSSVTGLQSNVQVNNINGITPNWVQNIFDPMTNTHPYQAQHIGIVPVNTGTTVNTLIQAYPRVNFGGINPNLTLRQLYPNIIQR